MTERNSVIVLLGIALTLLLHIFMLLLKKQTCQYFTPTALLALLAAKPVPSSTMGWLTAQPCLVLQAFTPLVEIFSSVATWIWKWFNCSPAPKLIYCKHAINVLKQQREQNAAVTPNLGVDKKLPNAVYATSFWVDLTKDLTKMYTKYGPNHCNDAA